MYITLEELKERLEEQNDPEAMEILMDDDSGNREEEIPDGTEELSYL